MAVLSKKKITLAKLSACPQKTFGGPYVWLYVGSFGRKQELHKGHLSVWATIKTHLVAAAHSHVVFCFSRFSLLTFSGQFWQVSDLAFKRRPSFAKLYQNFRGKSPYINFIFKNPCMFQSYLTTFAKLSQKKYFSKQIEVLAFANSLWHTKDHRILLKTRTFRSTLS